MANAEKVQEIIERIGQAFSKLTVLRPAAEDEVMKALERFLTAADIGDARSAAVAASELTSRLIGCGARRASGDIMMDYVLSVILLSGNPFARSAAAGRMDEALFRAMRRDLDAMRTLSMASRA